MAIYKKPENDEVNKIWASTAPEGNVKTPTDAYANKGWTQIKPPYEYFNWWMKNVSTLLAYLNQHGISEWDENTEYVANNSFVQSEGKLWVCLKNNKNSKPSDSNDNWKDYLKGIATQSYTDRAVDTFKRSLHKIATTGLATDLDGQYPWSRLSDVPRFIRDTQEEGDRLSFKSSDGTTIRVGNGRLDLINGGDIKFSINPDGVLDNGRIPVSNLQGVLPKSQGGTGRSDNIVDMQYFDAYGGVTTCGFRFGGDDHNKITPGSNDEDPEHSGNITIDTWNSLAVRSSINSWKTAWKLCARSGKTYQRGDFQFFGGGEKTIANYGNAALWIAGDNNTKIKLGYGAVNFHTDKGEVISVDNEGNLVGKYKDLTVKSNTGDLTLKNGSLDSLHLVSGNACYLSNNEGKTTVRWDSGRLTVGVVPFERVEGLKGAGRWEVQTNSDIWGQGYGSGNLAREETVAKVRDWANDHFIKLGQAAYVSVFDKGGFSASDIPWGPQAVVSTGTFRTLCEYTRLFWGYHPAGDTWYNNLKGESRELLTTAQFKNFKDDITTPGNFCSYVVARKIYHNSHVNRGDTVGGDKLMPSSCVGRNDSGGEGNRLTGTWKCAGWAASSSYDDWESKTTLWVRIG